MEADFRINSNCRKSYIFNRAIFRVFSLLLLLCCSLKSMAEIMYPIPGRDSVNKLLLRLPKTRNDTARVEICLGLAEYYLEKNLDSGSIFIYQALALSDKLNYKNGQARSHCLLGLLLDYKSDSIGSANQFERALAISQESGNRYLEAFIWYKRGECVSNGTRTDFEYICYQKARALYKSLGKKVNEAYMLKTIADFHFNQGKVAVALKELFETLETYKSAGYQNLHNTYDLIGAIYKSMGNYEESLRYAFAALNSAQQTKDTSDITLFNGRLGRIYYELGQWDDAVKYYQIVLQRSMVEGDMAFLRNAAGYVAGSMSLSGKPQKALQFYLKIIREYPALDGDTKYQDGKHLGDLYLSLKQHSLAEKYYLQMLNTNSFAANAESHKLTALITVGNFYIAVHQFTKAKGYLLKALNMVSTNSSYQLPQIHQLLFKVDSASSEYISAIRHYQVFKSINDSIFNEKKINQFASLQMKFETEKKDKDIILLTARTKEQQVILKKQVLLRNAMIAGSGMLLLLLWFIFNRYQVKNKTALQLEAQQEIINNEHKKLEELLTDKEDLIASKNELITEKEWLLKEVHHRVKNNLQMVMTLLYTQSAYLKDPQALDAILESQNRIHAISLIHQKLYQSENLEVINVKSYIHELVDNLKDSFDKNNTIETELDIESLELDVSRSIPVGLMLNEAVTNAMKYAFSNNPEKLITVSLKRQDDGLIVLMIKDNGRGLPAGFEPLESKTLGLKLIKGLCKQIKADCSIENNPGVCITIRFGNTEDSDEVSDNSVFENNQNSIS